GDRGTTGRCGAPGGSWHANRRGNGWRRSGIRSRFGVAEWWPEFGYGYQKSPPSWVCAVSWSGSGGQADAVLDGTSKFAPDILRRELDVEHGGMDLGMAHQMHQSWQ